MTTSRATASAAGFTLIELLCVTGIIAVLLGLTLPSIQAARGAARRAECATRMRQLGLAIHGYESTWGGFPPLGTGTGFKGTASGRHLSLHVGLLPYLEQNELFQQINLSANALLYDAVGYENRTVRDTSVASFLCPTDTGARAPGMVNSRANAGLCTTCSEAYAGPFSFGVASSVASIRDGLSNTLAFSEKPVGSADGEHSGYRDWLDVEAGTWPEPAGLWPGAADRWLGRCARADRRRVGALAAGRTWLLGGGVYTEFFPIGTPNSPVPDCGTLFFSGTGHFAARSGHPGGVNAGLADGSVRWFSSSLSLAVWRSLGTRAGGEPAP